jgi:hypothetical protein
MALLDSAKSVPIELRHDLVVRTGSLISRDVAELAAKHKLVGAVLITFSADRIGVASTGLSAEFAKATSDLADKLVVMLADGKLDP